MVNLHTSLEDGELIEKIVDRVRRDVRKIGLEISTFRLPMDITAVHANGCPLRLEELLKADDFHFWHDIIGVTNSIDRDTGALRNCFEPRFAAPRPAPTETA